MVATLPTLDSRSAIQKLVDNSLRVVLVGRTDVPVDNVSADFERGGFLATQHLINLGHTRIGFVGAEFSEASRVSRLQGYLEAFHRAGVQVRPQYVIGNPSSGGGPSYSTRETGAAATKKLLALATPPTAIFARNDYTALGALEALDLAAVKVPEQVSIVGFDNIPMSGYSLPPLTTVEQPTTAQAVMATEFLLDRLEGRAQPAQHRHTVLDCNLVIRRSTGTAPVAK